MMIRQRILRTVLYPACSWRISTVAAAATAAGFFAVAHISSTARALEKSAPHEDEPVVPTFGTRQSIPKVEIKPDLQTTSFSAQNAYFFSKMSGIAYMSKSEAQSVLLGNETSEGLGFDHFYWFEADPVISRESAFDAIHDTQAFIAANDELILAVFRGTKEGIDWVTNLNVLLEATPMEWNLDDDCHLHKGFNDGTSTVWLPAQDMHDTIKNLYNEKGKKRKLYLAGHSLGGALATVAAAHLAFTDNIDIAGMYTIGSPRVFDGSLAAFFDAFENHGTPLKKKYFRCRNNNDIVPRVVPPPYVHVGNEIYLDRFGHLAETSFLDRLLGRLSALLRGEITEGVNDHSTSEYTRLFKQLVINSKISLLEKTKSVMKDATHKVWPINQDGAKALEQDIEDAKAAAVKASKETYKPPEHLPLHDHDIKSDEL